MTNNDRIVYARGQSQWDPREIIALVRYDRAGKWRVEGPTVSYSCNLRVAAETFAWCRDRGGECFFGLPGGKSLYSEAAKLDAKRRPDEAEAVS